MNWFVPFFWLGGSQDPLPQDKSSFEQIEENMVIKMSKHIDMEEYLEHKGHDVGRSSQ